MLSAIQRIHIRKQKRLTHIIEESFSCFPKTEIGSTRHFSVTTARMSSCLTMAYSTPAILIRSAVAGVDNMLTRLHFDLVTLTNRDHLPLFRGLVRRRILRQMGPRISLDFRLFRRQPARSHQAARHSPFFIGIFRLTDYHSLILRKRLACQGRVLKTCRDSCNGIHPQPTTKRSHLVPFQHEECRVLRHPLD